MEIDVERSSGSGAWEGVCVPLNGWGWSTHFYCILREGSK
jgi:hypothetical protein